MLRDNHPTIFFAESQPLTLSRHRWASAGFPFRKPLHRHGWPVRTRSGPAYETPAEARYLRTIGADAVGMSTVLETIAARALGREVAGFSLITNVHGTGAPTAHEEVLEASRKAAARIGAMIEGLIAIL